MSYKVVAQVQQATKQYRSGDSMITALQPTDLVLRQGELTLIIGPSGSGKTTLLSLLGCVIYPTSGEVVIDGTATSSLSDKSLADLRLRKIGFVFQNFNLIAPLTAIENVMLPLRLLGVPAAQANRQAIAALERVNMGHRRHSLSRLLSGGEQQRVCIARALVADPPLVLCDEPTASLDPASVGIVMTELQDLAKRGKALAVVTHDQRLRPFADRVVVVENGFARVDTTTEVAMTH